MTVRRLLGRGLVLAALILAAVQLLPYGRGHTNPPDGALVAFDRPDTETLARRACFDCHSNHTRWPWYASIAPMSWRIQSHVDEGRAALNFTAFDATSEEMTEAAREAGEAVLKGEMPPADYLLAHPEARLTAAEKRALAQGLDRTLSAFGENHAGDGHGPGRAGADAASRIKSGKGKSGKRDD